MSIGWKSRKGLDSVFGRSWRVECVDSGPKRDRTFIYNTLHAAYRLAAGRLKVSEIFAFESVLMNIFGGFLWESDHLTTQTSELN